MTVFNLTTIQCLPGGTAPALSGLERMLLQARTPSLLGCWISEIGTLNEIVVLRRYEGNESLESEIFDARRFGANPEIGPGLLSVTNEKFASFPGIAPITQGKLGKFYEIRTYHLKSASESLGKTVEAWKSAVRDRAALSPLAIVMQGIDGAKRIVHIWPFRTLDERQAVRAEAFQKNLWPPRGTLQWMEGAKSSIYVPAPFSPLQ